MYNVCMGDAYGFIQTLDCFCMEEILKQSITWGEGCVYGSFSFVNCSFAINLYHQYNNVCCVKTFLRVFQLQLFHSNIA